MLSNEEKLQKLAERVNNSAGGSPASSEVPATYEEGNNEPPAAKFMGKLINAKREHRVSYSVNKPLRMVSLLDNRMIECYYTSEYIEIYTKNYDPSLPLILKISEGNNQALIKQILNDAEMQYYIDIDTFYTAFGEMISDWGAATPARGSDKHFIRAAFTEAILRNLPVYPDLLDEDQNNIFKSIKFEVRTEANKSFSDMPLNVRMNNLHCLNNYMHSENFLIGSKY